MRSRRFQLSTATGTSPYSGPLSCPLAVAESASLREAEAHLATRLKLETLYEREVTVADGSKHTCPYVGPIEVRFANRGGFAGALVMGDEVLLGAVQMEDLDLVVSPATGQVTVNPANPDVAGARA